jgi:hypothetical protein
MSDTYDTDNKPKPKESFVINAHSLRQSELIIAAYERVQRIKAQMAKEKEEEHKKASSRNSSQLHPA